MLAVISIRAGLPGTAGPGAALALVEITPELDTGTWVDRSRRIVTVAAACGPLIASSCPVASDCWLTGIAAVTPRSRVTWVTPDNGSALASADPDLRANGEGGLVVYRLPPALVLRERERARADGEDHQERRATLPDRAAADLPVRHRRAEPPAPCGELLQALSRKRQQPQRDEREPGQRQRRRGGNDQIGTGSARGAPNR